MAKIAVIGCGNPNRSDDGVGLHVINLLYRAGVPDDVQLYDAGTDGMSVMYLARGATHLIIVDAKSPEHSPGAVFDVPGAVLEAPPPASLNLHDFRWDHALYAGRRIHGDQFPRAVSVILIEAASLQLGLGLSVPVTEAAAKVALRIRARIAVWSEVTA